MGVSLCFADRDAFTEPDYRPGNIVVRSKASPQPSSFDLTGRRSSRQGERWPAPPQLPNRHNLAGCGEHLDWVLVLDDAGKNFPPPGQKK
jgi:hypothetical protein